MMGTFGERAFVGIIPTGIGRMAEKLPLSDTCPNAHCLNHARADFISRGCGNDYRIVCLRSVEVKRVIEFDFPDGYELQNGDWGSDDE